MRDRQAGPGVREEVRRGDPREISRQAAGLQLLAELQLEGEPGRRHDREVPEGDRDLRLQVPVHNPGRLPRAELLDVQPRPWLRAPADERVRRAEGGRVRRGRTDRPRYAIQDTKR